MQLSVVSCVGTVQDEREGDSGSKKKRRGENDTPEISSETTAPTVVQPMVSSDQIKAMMNQAKAHITQRKQDLQIKVGV